LSLWWMFVAELIFTRVVGLRSIIEDEDLSELLVLSELKVDKTWITKLLCGSTPPLSTPIFTIDGWMYLVCITSTTDVTSSLVSSVPILSIIEFKLVPFKFVAIWLYSCSSTRGLYIHHLPLQSFFFFLFFFSQRHSKWQVCEKKKTNKNNAVPLFQKTKITKQTKQKKTKQKDRSE
jgi:hypothetical protein